MRHVPVLRRDRDAVALKGLPVGAAVRAACGRAGILQSGMKYKKVRRNDFGAGLSQTARKSSRAASWTRRRSTCSRWHQAGH